MEIINLYTETISQFQYYDGIVEVTLDTKLDFRNDYVLENSIYETFLDIEVSLKVSNSDTGMITEYDLYSVYDQKPFIDTYYTSIVDIVNDEGDLIESGADIRIPSPELTDIWGSHYDIEIDSNGNWNFTFYNDNDEYLYSKSIKIPSNIKNADFYQNKYLDSRLSNIYFANYWEQIYNQEFMAIGKSEGYFEGLEKGILQGKEIGIEEGYQLGYEVGFGEGKINRPLTTFGTVIKVISDNASNLLKTEILPNFTISNIIFIPVIFSLLGIVFKFFRR